MAITEKVKNLKSGQKGFHKSGTYQMDHVVLSSHGTIGKQSINNFHYQAS